MSRLDNESWHSFPLGSVANKKEKIAMDIHMERGRIVSEGRGKARDKAREAKEEEMKIIKERLEEAKSVEKATPFDWSSSHYRNR